MANVGGPKTFWNILKGVSVADIAKEANRPISIAVVGEEEARVEVLQALYAGDPTEPLDEQPTVRALPESPFVQGFEAMTEEAQFPQETGVFDLVIDTGGGREGAPSGIPIYSLHELGGWEGTLERILDDRPQLALPLARNFPAFRRRVAQRIITETATVNAQFSLLTGISAALPFTAILLPVNSLSDIVILTKNQAMMTLRLAAAYGLEVDYKHRTKELAPLLGNALGWRTIARQLVGLVPVVGFLTRAMIAYAGTVTIGKAAEVYYETGEKLTMAQMKRIYAEAFEASRDRVKQLAEALRGGRGGGPGSRNRLPAPAVNAITEKSAESSPALPASSE